MRLTPRGSPSAVAALGRHAWTSPGGRLRGEEFPPRVRGAYSRNGTISRGRTGCGRCGDVSDAASSDARIGDEGPGKGKRSGGVAGDIRGQHVFSKGRTRAPPRPMERA